MNSEHDSSIAIWMLVVARQVTQALCGRPALLPYIS